MIKTLKTTIKGLAQRKDFDSREDFLDWFWYQIPNQKYPSQTLKDNWLNFLDTVTFAELRFEIGMWWCRKFGKRKYGYSEYYHKSGYWFKNQRGDWWFTPDDKSFLYSSCDCRKPNVD